MTGLTDEFYPNYDSDGTDPYAAQDRGYYFTGSSLMQMPPHTSSDESELILAAENTFSFWVRPTSGTGVLFSKQADSTQVVYYEISLNAYVPELTMRGYDLSTLTITT